MKFESLVVFLILKNMTEVDDKLAHEKLAVNLLNSTIYDLILNILVDKKEINIYYYDETLNLLTIIKK